SNIEALGRPMVAPPGCVGRYLNGNIEWSVSVADTGVLSLIDGDVASELILLMISASRRGSNRQCALGVFCEIRLPAILSECS
ncbi:MAG: hypothetical protein LC808_21815, partial [Actinobacteria bacterium]|nr:hypothetical protein [Actinomycetota bacterium]